MDSLQQWVGLLMLLGAMIGCAQHSERMTNADPMLEDRQAYVRACQARLMKRTSTLGARTVRTECIYPSEKLYPKGL